MLNICSCSYLFYSIYFFLNFLLMLSICSCSYFYSICFFIAYALHKQKVQKTQLFERIPPPKDITPKDVPGYEKTLNIYLIYTWHMLNICGNICLIYAIIYIEILTLMNYLHMLNLKFWPWVGSKISEILTPAEVFLTPAEVKPVGGTLHYSKGSWRPGVLAPTSVLRSHFQDLQTLLFNLARYGGMWKASFSFDWLIK